MKQYEQIVTNALPRTNSYKNSNSNNTKIIPSNNHLLRSTSSSSELPLDHFHHRRGRRRSSSESSLIFQGGVSTFLRSLLSIFTFPSILPTCRWLNNTTDHNHLATIAAPSLGRKVTGTLFGHRRGHVTFAVQYDPKSEPVLLIELAVSTSSLVKEMSSGLVRIALECEKIHGGGKKAARRLFMEPMWTMYCNGRKCGYAASRACNASDWHVLRTVGSVSVGAGVIPVVDDGGASEGELLYMRARFERVVGSRDSEAFYMLNPDGNGGPELSIFLLRI